MLDFLHIALSAQVPLLSTKRHCDIHVGHTNSSAWIVAVHYGWNDSTCKTAVYKACTKEDAQKIVHNKLYRRLGKRTRKNYSYQIEEIKLPGSFALLDWIPDDIFHKYA